MSKLERRRLLAKQRAARAERARSDDRESKGKKKPRKTSFPESIVGVKYVKLLEKIVFDLRDEQGAHGNRRLFLDDVFVVYLMAFFNPVVRSLRTFEDLSQTPKVQRYLSVPSICKSTLSDFNKLIDPERLKPILDALREHLSDHVSKNPIKDPDLQSLLKQVIAVDGTFFPAVSEVAWAVANSNNHGRKHYRARVDTRIDVHTWLPEAIVIPDPCQSESASAIAHLQPGKIYLYDRGYSGFDLIAAHYTQGTTPNEALKAISNFVVRYKKEGSNASGLVVVNEKPILEEDRDAGVIGDRVGYFQSDSAKDAGITDLLLREVVIAYEEKGEQKTLRLITNLFDVSAGTIGLLYSQRWQVELFFRWFKTVANFGHLISHSKQGALAHLYVTIIGLMLTYLHSDYRPSKYMFAMLHHVAMGAASLGDILPILQERERQNALARASAARRRAKNKQ